MVEVDIGGRKSGDANDADNWFGVIYCDNTTVGVCVGVVVTDEWRGGEGDFILALLAVSKSLFISMADGTKTDGIVAEFKSLMSDGLLIFLESGKAVVLTGLVNMTLFAEKRPITPSQYPWKKRFG